MHVAILHPLALPLHLQRLGATTHGDALIHKRHFNLSTCSLDTERAPPVGSATTTTHTTTSHRPQRDWGGDGIYVAPDNLSAATTTTTTSAAVSRSYQRCESLPPRGKAPPPYEQQAEAQCLDIYYCAQLVCLLTVGTTRNLDCVPCVLLVFPFNPEID